jgi:hypothetical protein
MPPFIGRCPLSPTSPAEATSGVQQTAVLRTPAAGLQFNNQFQRFRTIRRHRISYLKGKLGRYEIPSPWIVASNVQYIALSNSSLVKGLSNGRLLYCTPL